MSDPVGFVFSKSFFRAVAMSGLILTVLQSPAGRAQSQTAGAMPVQLQRPEPVPDGNVAANKMNQEYIRVWRTIMTPKNVADAFGTRIARRYIAMQVTIANRNKDYQWLIQDASIDLEGFLADETNRFAASKNRCEQNASLLQLAAVAEELRDSKVTSADLKVLRGVAEKGQALDPRNLTLRSLTGAGAIAAGLIGVAKFGLTYSSAVAAFNGPLLEAFKGAFPDYTVEQINRLNDSAFLANTIIGKQQAKVLVMFIPQPYLLTKKQQREYYKDPESVYNCADLRLLGASVNGNFISSVSAPALAASVTSAQWNEAQ